MENVEIRDEAGEEVIYLHNVGDVEEEENGEYKTIGTILSCIAIALAIISLIVCVVSTGGAAIGLFFDFIDLEGHNTFFENQGLAVLGIFNSFLFGVVSHVMGIIARRKFNVRMLGKFGVILRIAPMVAPILSVVLQFILAIAFVIFMVFDFIGAAMNGAF